MSPPARSLTEADRAEWANFARLLTPLPGRPPPAIVDIPPPAALLPKRPQLPVPLHAPRSPSTVISIGNQPGGVDSATWQRFRTGKLGSARKLDLHGMTAQHAFHALTAFLRIACADRLRCVEIITGRGSTEGGGRIRREFPLWLNLPDIRPLILGAVHPHAANPGSVRLLLRRMR
jgi:hypothetical protein